LITTQQETESMTAQNKLGEFIRAHRERIKPEDIGLPGGGRRRTPGLRREELAQLCAVSPTWLTWLEQGRPVSASPRTLGKIADVMHLTAAERAYLFSLAEKLDPVSEADAETPSDNLGAIVNAVRTPAYVLDRQWNAVAWNRPAQTLFADWLAPRKAGQPMPNLLRFMFLDSAARKFIVGWPDRADRLVAEFRADCGKHADREPVKKLVDELCGSSAEFRKRWNSQNVVDREGGERRFRHAGVESVFEQTTLHPATRRDLKLVILIHQG
jgi:transcriptional regulator with XRE-family HTH domain